MRLVTFAFTSALAVAMMAQYALAQDSVMPDTGYGSQPDHTYGLPEALPPTPGVNEPAANSVSIPIPGGGAITVEGPDAPTPHPLPPLGGDTWTLHQTNPFNPGSGAMGP